MSNVLGTSCRSRRSSASRTRAASRCWSTAASRPCTSASTCRISTPTSTSSPATRPTGPPASACSTPRRRISTPCAPYQGGGDMIESVARRRITYGKPPHKFEAGTPPIVQAIGLGAALDYMMQVGRDRIARHEAELRDYAHERAGRAAVAEDLRQRAGQGRHRLVHHRRAAPARHRHHHRPLGRRGARRPSLRAAADGAARRHGRRAAPRSPCTTPRQKWMRSPRR